MTGYVPQPDFINVAGTLFFRNRDSEHGMELWKSDGSSSGTQLVTDINPGPMSSQHFHSDNLLRAEWLNIGSTLFFAADDGVNRSALWKSDGTCSGTVMVRNMDSMPIPYSYLLRPAYFTEVNGTLYFFGHDRESGFELWRSDGTCAGTTLVADAYPGVNVRGQRPFGIVNAAGQLFYTTSDPEHGQELWVSDGTCAGTHLVRDIEPGPSGAYPLYLTNVGGMLFFTMKSGPDGAELWRSDGTSSGTVLVRDIAPGISGSRPSSLLAVGERLYFVADDDVHGRELWTSDGTSEGTLLVEDIFPGQFGSDPEKFVNVNGDLYFTANEPSHGRELWRAVVVPPTASAAAASGVRLEENLVDLVLGISEQPTPGSDFPATSGLAISSTVISSTVTAGTMTSNSAPSGNAVDTLIGRADLNWVILRLMQDLFSDEEPDAMFPRR